MTENICAAAKENNVIKAKMRIKKLLYNGGLKNGNFVNAARFTGVYQ
jgi:hypothetical protein